MSMHDAEAFVEFAIRSVDASGLPISEKRDLIHTLFILEEYGDCGFTHRRTLREMVDCQYTFLFGKEEMWDYEDNKEFYDSELPGRPWDANGQIYYMGRDKDFPEASNKYCVDSGSPAWEAMVACGKITGEGAKPVKALPFAETFLTARALILATYDDFDGYSLRGYYSLVFMSGTVDALPPDTSDEDFVALTGMTREQLENEEYPDIDDDDGLDGNGYARVFRLCGQLLPLYFRMDTLEDRSLDIHGYISDHFSLPVWNIPAELCLLPPGLPGRYNQFGGDDAPLGWLVDLDEKIAELEGFMQELHSGFAALDHARAEALIPPDFDRKKLESVMTRYNVLIQEAPQNPDKIRELAEVLNDGYALFGQHDFPDSVLAEDAPFACLISYFSNAADGALSLARTVDGLACIVPELEVLAAGWRRQAGVVRERNMRGQASPEELERLNALQGEYAALMGTGPGPQDNGRLVKILDTIWRSPHLLKAECATYAGALLGFYNAAERMLNEYEEHIYEQYKRIPDAEYWMPAVQREIDALLAWVPASLRETSGAVSDAAPVLARFTVNLDETVSAATTVFYSDELTVTLRNGKFVAQ